MDKTQQVLESSLPATAPALGIIARTTAAAAPCSNAAATRRRADRHRFELALARTAIRACRRLRRDGEAAFRFDIIDTSSHRPIRFRADAELDALLALHQAQLLEQGQSRY